MAQEMRLECGITSKVDMFSYGCLLFWALTGGKHPFGEMCRESKIMRSEYDLSELKGHIAYPLIKKLIHDDPQKRPEAHYILSDLTKQYKGHPTFWTEDEKLDFYCSVSDDLKASSGLQACKELEFESPVGKLKGLQKRLKQNCTGKCGKPQAECGVVSYISDKGNVENIAQL